MSLHGRHSAKDTAQFSPPAAAAARPDEDRAPAQRPPGEKVPRQKEESGLGFLRELPILILIAFVIAIVIKTFVVQAFYIPSESMQNTLLVNDRVLVSKFIYKFKDPRPGDIKHSQAEITRAREHLGYEPKVTFEEGLRHTIEWYRLNT